MQTKLTLRLEKDLIERIKAYARTRGTSLSRLVAVYFKSLEEQQSDEGELTPVVKELRGVIATSQSAEELVEKYRWHLDQKYR